MDIRKVLIVGSGTLGQQIGVTIERVDRDKRQIDFRVAVENAAV